MMKRLLSAVLMALPLAASAQVSDHCQPSRAEPPPVLPVVVIEGHRPAGQRVPGNRVPIKPAPLIEVPAGADAHAMPPADSASLERMLFQTRDAVAQLRRDLSELRAEVRQMHRFQLMHPELPTQGHSATAPTLRSD